MFSLFKRKKETVVRLKANFVEYKNIPWALFDDEEPEFHIYDVVKEDRNIRLYYQLVGKGFAVWFTDREKYNEFRIKIRVVIGHWAETRGRWCPEERYKGSIICEGVSKLIKLSDKGENYKFKVRQEHSSTKILKIESEEIGIIEIHCQAIVPQVYEISLFSFEQDKWILRKDLGID